MPDLGQTYANVDKALKEVYAPAMKLQIPKISPLYNLIEKKPKEAFAGKQFIIPLQLTFTESVGGSNDDSSVLPTPHKITYDQAIVKVKKIYGRIGIEGLARDASKNNKGGWIDLLTNETKGATNAYAIDVDRQLLGDGKGVLGTTAASAASGATTVNITSAGAGFNDTNNPTRFFRKGMKIVFSASPTNVYEITGVTSTAINIYPGLAAAITAPNTVYRSSVYHADANKLGEMMGINGIVDVINTPGSTFEGLDASTLPEWQAWVGTTGDVSAGTTVETRIQDALDAIEQRSGGEPIDMSICSYAVRNALIKKMQSLRQIDTLDLKAGWKAIKYIGGAIELPLLVHPKLPAGYIFFLAMPHLKIYELTPFSWDNSGGGIIKPVAGYDAYEAWFKTYMNFGTDCRNAHGKYTNLTLTDTPA